ncbi:MAG TPA: hypothetical protein VM536_04105 [Chloroflexia bacterium]|nr:hypothetical protein [Chloroflexia bacterium]
MDTQNTGIATLTAPAYCTCCTPRQLLIPRDDLDGAGRWAVCVGSGAWYESRGAAYTQTAPPQPGVLTTTYPQQELVNAWAGGGQYPAIVPGIRIDLSKQSYA